MDASGTHIRAALMQQESQDQPWVPITFYSKGLNSAQRKYWMHELKLLACYLTVRAQTRFSLS